MVENEQLEVIESEGDGWMRVSIDCFYCLSVRRMGGVIRSVLLDTIHFFYMTLIVSVETINVICIRASYSANVCSNYLTVSEHRYNICQD